MASLQAKDAIRRLKLAGWQRNQFSVKTERKYVGNHPVTGKAMYEYGNVSIILWNSSKEEQLAKINAMADQGFYVGLFEFSDGHIGHPHIMDRDRWTKPGVWLKKETVIDEYGFHIEERIY